MLLNPVVGKAKIHTRYRTTIYADGTVEGQGTGFLVTQQDGKLSFPVSQDHQNELSFQMGVHTQNINTNAVLPDAGVGFPKSLWDVRAGFTQRRMFENRWLGVVSVSLGSPSDEPFASADEISGQATAFLRVPHGIRNAWVFFLNYSNDREFLNGLPLPGVSYQYEPSGKAKVLFGIPITSAEWKPVGNVKLRLTYLLLRTVHAGAEVRMFRRLTWRADFFWWSRRYRRANRTRDDDRLFYNEKKVEGGVRVSLGNSVWVDFSGGFAFDRFYFEGEDYDDRGRNRLDLGDAVIGSFQIGTRF